MDDRTQIAAMCLQALLGNPDTWDPDYHRNVRSLPGMAIQYADELLARLKPFESSPGPAPRIASPPLDPLVPSPGEEIKPSKVPISAFDCETDRFPEDRPCVGSMTRDPTSRGWFCRQHIDVPETIRREWHKRNGHRNRPKDEAR